MADIYIADPKADHEAGHRQNRPGGNDRSKSFIHRGNHRLTFPRLLLQGLIAVHDHDRIVDCRAHLNRRHNHVCHKGRSQVLEIREGEVDPDASLNDKRKQRRACYGPEGKQQDHEDKRDCQNRDLLGISGIGCREIPGTGDLPDNQDIAFSVIFLAFRTDRIRQSDTHIALHRHIRVEDQAVIFLAAKLQRPPPQLFPELLDLLCLLRIQVHHSLIDLLEQIFKHIQQCDTVLICISKEHLVLLMLDPVSLKQKARRLIIQIQKLCEHLRRKGIRQDMSLPHLNIRKPGRIPHVIHFRNRVQDRLLMFIFSGRNDHGNHVGIRKRVTDLMHGLPARRIDNLRNRGIGKCIFRLF